MLVLSSHGHEGSISGSDGKHVTITELMELLSPKNFPAMRGKPKLVIIQACAGGELNNLIHFKGPVDSFSSTGAKNPFSTATLKIVMLAYDFI